MDSGLTLGSLFDGIGGFPLAAAREGIVPIWASEITASAVSITRRHFPAMRHLGDITQIDGAAIEPVDIITFGSPCQDLSISGRRAGLGGKRSGLFMQAVRIIKEMRNATNGKCPARIVWENVPGAFSSQEGRDFHRVIEEIAKIADAGVSIPRPALRGGWLAAGAVVGDCWSLAWRVLDAQYWGVPQRRRRIYLVGDFTGQRAGEILFKQHRETGDFEKGNETGEGVAGHADSGLGQFPVKAYCIVGNTIDRTEKSGGNGTGVNEEISFTLNTVDRHAVVVLNDQGGDRVLVEKTDISPCLRSECHGNLPIVAQYSSFQDTAGCLCSRDYKGVDENKCISNGNFVRRLTPLECERLQGYPDGWTEYGHDGKRISDNQRYKAIGNSVAVPCVQFVLSGMKNSNVL